MIKVALRSVWLLPVVLLSTSLLAPSPALTQAQNTQALGLVRDAMDAYSNLDLDTAKNYLDSALGLASQIDNSTLARVYVSYGVLQIGGFTDNAQGQRNFMIAQCLDSTIMVDPLLSTPEIDIVFTMAKKQAGPAQCPQLLATINKGGTPGPGPVPPAALPQCGVHSPPTSQKQKHELPLYLELAPQMRGQAARLVIKFQFDGSGAFAELPMTQVGIGYGAQITCDEGQIRIFDPSSISYYIEGFDRMGNLVCGHGSAQMPLVVAMDPMAAPLPGLPGMTPPKECAPCPPWDQSCGLPGEGESCDPARGCADGLLCGDAGVCETEDSGPAVGGPQTFYVSLGGGVGFGYMTMEMEFDKIASGGGDDYSIEHVKDSPAGFAWGGIPVRLWAGYWIIPDLSVEIGGRFDVKIDSFSEPVSCWDGAGKSMTGVEGATCTNDPQNEEEAKESVALTDLLDDGGEPVERKSMRVAWLANARVRYQVVNNGMFRYSIFGGVGYGRIKYRVAAGDEPYFPMPGFIDIEIGTGIALYFTENFGMVVDVPIDVLVADGFALNFDVILGLSFGF